MNPNFSDLGNHLIEEAQAGKLFLRVELGRGLVALPTGMGGGEDAIPLAQMPIALIVQEWLDGGGQGRWAAPGNQVGVIFVEGDEETFVALSLLGVNKRLGFFVIPDHPADEINEAALAM